MTEMTLETASTGAQVALRILRTWTSSDETCSAILGIPENLLERVESEQLLDLDNDQLARISHVFNIHAALRTMFDNPDNVRGFVNMRNDSPSFNGQKPSDLMKTGDLGALALVDQYLQAQAQNGCW